jgi:outer membrane lipoprotein-sorting protein
MACRMSGKQARVADPPGCAVFLARWRGRLALLLMSVTVSACATVRPVSPAAVRPIPNREQVTALIQAMVVRDRTLTSLSTGAVMEYRNANQHVKAREQIVVMRPDRLRVEASSPFGVALIVAVDGPRLQIFEPGNNLLMHGAASAATLNRFARIPMEPKAAVDLLMAVVPDSGAMAAQAAAAIIDETGATVLTYAAPGGGHREAAFADGELTAVRERDRDGQLIYQVRYADYHNIGAVMFPYSIDADFPAAGSELKLTLKRPIVNAHEPESLFALTPASTTKEIDLDHREPSERMPQS